MRILLLADIHIGNIKDTKYVYNVITNIIDQEIIFKHSDMVVILGDYFDKLFKTNEDFVSLAINVMSYIVRACIKCNTKIRIIYGTESHEMNQYKIFNYHLTSDNVDMKIFDTVTEEVIDGRHILYVPEEYVDDKFKHYAKYLNSSKSYDYIFGHGIIEEGMPNMITVSNENNKNKEKHVPRFKSKELSSVSKLCIFGHYHVMTDVGDGVYYLGSLFRNSFGEETPKYYGIITDDEIEFIENTDAYVYKTYEYPITSDIYNGSTELTEEVSRIKKENEYIFNGNKFGKIRMIFYTDTNTDPSFKENVKNIVFTISNIVPLIKEENHELVDEIQEELDDELSFVIDRSLSIVDKFHMFMSMGQEEPPMTIDKLSGYISKYIPNNKTIDEGL